jgi:hypothetical protein
MRRNGRGADPVFSAAEKLFRRYAQEHFMAGQFSNMGFSFSNPPSLNRQKYSLPQDVLFSETDEWIKWGVLSFQVQDVPPFLPVPHPEFTFTLEHAPLEFNYAHSQIQCDTIPASDMYVEPRKAIRKLARTALSQRIKVEIEAQL